MLAGFDGFGQRDSGFKAEHEKGDIMFIHVRLARKTGGLCAQQDPPKDELEHVKLLNPL